MNNIAEVDIRLTTQKDDTFFFLRVSYIFVVVLAGQGLAQATLEGFQGICCED